MNEVRIEKTGQPDVVSTSDGRLTLSVPIQIKRRSGRKLEQRMRARMHFVHGRGPVGRHAVHSGGL